MSSRSKLSGSTRATVVASRTNTFSVGCQMGAGAKFPRNERAADIDTIAAS